MQFDKTKILKHENILYLFAVAIIICAGIYIRIKYYLHQIPMWLDEIMLGCNFTDRTMSDLFIPLDAYQKVPPLFFFLLCRLENSLAFRNLL